MIELIILGIVLFIVGVGATFIYDRYKDRLQDLNKIKQSFGQPETLIQNSFEQIKKSLSSGTKPKRKSKSSQSIEEEFLARFKEHTDSVKSKPKPKVKKTIKPGSIKAGYVNPNQVPEETQFLEELFEDVSIKSTITVQELKDKIERMKKKS